MSTTLRRTNCRLRFLVGLAAVLVLGLLVWFSYRKFMPFRPRFVPTPDLLEELADAEIVEDDLPPGPADWPQWRGPLRTGVTRQPSLVEGWPEKGPPSRWRIDGGDGYSSFAVRDGRVYTMLSPAAGQEAVLCYDTGTGKEQWRHAYDPGTSVDYAGPRATPTLDGDALFTLSSGGTLFCLDVKDGQPRWQVDLRQELGAVSPRWGFACSPLVEGDRVFVIAGGTRGRCLAAFHKADGRLLWGSQGDPAGYSSPIGMTVAGDRQIVFFTGRRLLGVAPEDGRLLWEFPWQTDYEVNAATPLPVLARVRGQERYYVFISSGYGKGCALVQVRPERKGKFTAQPVYESNELCSHFASPVLFQGHVYGLDENRDLTCLELRTGKVKWQQRGFRKGSLIRVDDHLIILGEDGKLALVEANSEEYREKARTRPFRNRCWSLPVLAEGKLFLRDQSKVMCLEVGGR